MQQLDHLSRVEVAETFASAIVECDAPGFRLELLYGLGHAKLKTERRESSDSPWFPPRSSEREDVANAIKDIILSCTDMFRILVDPELKDTVHIYIYRQTKDPATMEYDFAASIMIHPDMYSKSTPSEQMGKLMSALVDYRARRALQMPS